MRKLKYNINRLLSILNRHLPPIYKFMKFLRGILSKQYYSSDLLFESNKSTHINRWLFHDEDWDRIIHRFEDRRALDACLPVKRIDNCQDITEEVSFSQDVINFNGKTKTKDEWLYLFLDPKLHQWKNYSWHLRVQRNTNFREFQFAFRYQDFYNRYRYRFEDDHIYFDKAINGRFYNKMGVAPFHMELNVWYDVRIEAYENNFKCYVNEKLMMNDFDFASNLSAGSIAIILWENDGISNIKASVGPMSIYKLLRKK